MKTNQEQIFRSDEESEHGNSTQRNKFKYQDRSFNNDENQIHHRDRSRSRNRNKIETRSRSRSRSEDQLRNKRKQDTHQNEVNINQNENNKSEVQQGNEVSNDKNVPHKEEIEGAATNIRDAFLQFFGAVDHEKGFVFSENDRKKLQQEQKTPKTKNNKILKKINWNPSPNDWQQKLQRAMIHKIFKQDSQTRFSTQMLKIIEQIFFRVSYLFCSEASEQLFRLMFQILKISTNKINQLIDTHSFMQQISKANSKYIFFTFQYSLIKSHELKLQDPQKKQAYKRLGTDLLTVFKEQVLTIRI